MEAFSYQQHHPFLLDSAYYPNIPMEMPHLPHQVGEITNASSCFPYYSGATPEISATDESQMSYSSAVAQSHVGEETLPVSMEKKRKNSNGTSLSSGQSKDSKGSKNRRQRKPSGKLKEAEKKHKGGDLKATKASEESPEGYIHLRARRGQATDSHSLAERVRREKISERMKLLQGLVPGCEQVTGKALVLDEIINYVQSLQNQIEFLSMKLASMNPIIYNLGEDYDGCMIQQEKMGSMQQPGPSDFDNATNNYPMVDSSASFLLHGQVPTTLSQDYKSFLVQVDDHRQVFIDQAEFSNMCSFQ